MITLIIGYWQRENNMTPSHFTIGFYNRSMLLTYKMKGNKCMNIAHWKVYIFNIVIVVFGTSWNDMLF
jgi:hypothetical protein